MINEYPKMHNDRCGYQEQCKMLSRNWYDCFLEWAWCSEQDKQTSLNHYRNHRYVVLMLQKLHTIRCRRESQIKVFSGCQEWLTAEKTFFSCFFIGLRWKIYQEIHNCLKFGNYKWTRQNAASCVNLKIGCKTINCNPIDGLYARWHHEQSWITFR